MTGKGKGKGGVGVEAPNSHFWLRPLVLGSISYVLSHRNDELGAENDVLEQT